MIPAQCHGCSVLRRSCRHIGFLIPISVTLRWIDHLSVEILDFEMGKKTMKSWCGRVDWNLGIIQGPVLRNIDFSKWNWIIFCFGPSSGQPENAYLGSPSCCHSRGCDGRSRSACRSISGTSQKSIGPSVQTVRITQLGRIKDSLNEDSSCQNPIEN